MSVYAHILYSRGSRQPAVMRIYKSVIHVYILCPARRAAIGYTMRGVLKFVYTISMVLRISTLSHMRNVKQQNANKHNTHNHIKTNILCVTNQVT